jgi:hypothetical protein
LFVYQTLDNIDGKQVCQAAQPTITTTTQRHTQREREREREGGGNGKWVRSF